MPFVNGLFVEEAALSRNATRGSSSSIGTRFVVRGAGAEVAEDAVNAVRDHYASLNGITTEEGKRALEISADEVANEACVVTVSRNFNILAESFSTTGGTIHRSSSLATVGAYGIAPVNYQGAIGVTQNSVEGVDIPAPALQITRRRVFETVSVDFINRLARLTASVCATTFDGYEVGEVLFLGAEGTETSDNFVEVTYQFAIRPNETNITVGSIPVAVKRGWDYMWVQYIESFVGDRVLTVPANVYVEQVFRYLSWSDLNL